MTEAGLSTTRADQVISPKKGAATQTPQLTTTHPFSHQSTSQSPSSTSQKQHKQHPETGKPTRTKPCSTPLPKQTKPNQTKPTQPITPRARNPNPIHTSKPNPHRCPTALQTDAARNPQQRSSKAANPEGKAPPPPTKSSQVSTRPSALGQSVAYTARSTQYRLCS